MNSLFNRMMISPYLNKTHHQLHSTYLMPSDVERELNSLHNEIQHINQLGSSPSVEFRIHTLGSSMSGLHPLKGWTLGHPKNPRILCANQHHGPENVGPSFCFYLSYLLLKDPLFTPWLNRYSFSFFPQQNPDALTLHDNSLWMREPTWETFLQFHQYDPRKWDVEHGVLPKWFKEDDYKDTYTVYEKEID